ncbi:MAG: DUF2062 domain-containing protein [Novosphingobium sp.]|uniref:DUF2062 domain-containing protein n=1 Tax=Novosphingobium sp. TaxID=1874826 RepID=UPI0032BBBA44
MSTLITRIAGWAQRQMPKREELEHNRWIGPFARRPELWRFTRRSVPRGVAVGLLVGIFALIPGIQIIGAALLCVPSRGNIPLAAMMTFLSMPLTTPFILLGSAAIGNGLGFHVDLATVRQMMSEGASLKEWTYWFLSDAAPGVVTGLFVISVVAASIGYLIASFSWSWWIRHKRKLAQERLAQPELPE